MTNDQETRYKQIPISNKQLPNSHSIWLLKFDYWLLFGYCILVIGYFSGCTSVPTRRITETGEVVRVEKPLAVASILRFEDVPTPAGFNIVRDQSFIYQDASIRVGLLRYTGRANAAQIVSFFKSQMSLYNWNLINVVEFGNTTMNYVKTDESCIITIEPLATKSILNIVISPNAGSITTGFGSAIKKGKF